jgi:hypothetical protein
MIVPQLVPYGTVEVLSAGTMAAARQEVIDKEMSSEERKSFIRSVRESVTREHSHLYEVYGLVFGSNTEKVTAFNRQYEAVARLTWAQAFELMEGKDTLITSTWSDYSVAGTKGDTVWIAHRDSSDGKRAEPGDKDHAMISKVRAALQEVGR